MPIATVNELPPFDTGEFEGASLRLESGGAELSVRIAGQDDVVLSFRKCRWHEYVATYNCSPDQVKTAYFKLVEIQGSVPLSQFVKADRSTTKAYDALHHFRIFLDGHGCHEVFAESASMLRRKSLGGAGGV